MYMPACLEYILVQKSFSSNVKKAKDATKTSKKKKEQPSLTHKNSM
jgi:hypothetical protein